MNKNIIVCLILILMFVSGCGKAEEQVEMLEKIAPETTKCSFESLPEQEKEHGCKQFYEKTDIEETEVEKCPFTDIDRTERKCLKMAVSTADMRKCSYEAMDAWFLRIEKNMGALKSLLPVEKYAALEISQKKWKEYQKAEFESNNYIVLNKGGTIYHVISVDNKRELVKNRAMLLQYYVDIYSKQY